MAEGKFDIEYLASELARDAKEVLEKAKEAGFKVVNVKSKLPLQQIEALAAYITEGVLPQFDEPKKAAVKPKKTAKTEAKASEKTAEKKESKPKKAASKKSEESAEVKTKAKANEKVKFEFDKQKASCERKRGEARRGFSHASCSAKRACKAS